MSSGRRVGVVTDSTASLAADTTAEHGIEVVPLEVVVGDRTYLEGVDGLTSAELAQALHDKVKVSTSQSGPGAFLEAYQRLAAAGCEAIVSVHLSARLSGTHDSAVLAAAEAEVPVTVVDSQQVGMGLGFAVLAAARAAEAGGDAQAVATAARECAAQTLSLFYVDTLEHLRRGGRVGAAAALLGSALSVKPLLRLQDGEVVPCEKVRTAGKGLQRLAQLAVEAADHRPVDVAVAHLECRERADDLAATIGDWLDDELGHRDVVVVEIGAVLGAHVGPGMVGVAVAPHV